ncbi:MAG UNVERIFIED_CONTAM: hypothetical protein LVR29_26250 [Microcystis novacekii LVE1205-3]
MGDLRKVAHKTTKILAMGEDKQFIAEIWQHLQQRYQNQDLYFTQSSPTFFEVTHVEATKGSCHRIFRRRYPRITTAKRHGDR